MQTLSGHVRTRLSKMLFLSGRLCNRTRVLVLISDTVQFRTVGSNFGQREKESETLVAVERGDRQNKERESTHDHRRRG